MKRWIRIAGATVLILSASVSPAFAGSDPPKTLPMPAETVSQASEMTLRGVLTYMNLEGGFFSVGGWMLQGEQSRYEPLLGKPVIVTGTPFDGFSIQMVRSLTVTGITEDPDGSVSSGPVINPILTPIVDGLRTVDPARPTPASITYDGREVAFDQGPVVSDSTLMVPLRLLVEAAGGEVEWDGAARQITVRVPNRVALFTIGNDSAELIVDGQVAGAFRMAKPPFLAGDRTLVSADALSSILGFMERHGTESHSMRFSTAMDLVIPAPAPVDDLKSTLTGSIKEFGKTGTLRILVEGPAMHNGEPSLYWVTILGDTKVFAEENGQVTEASSSILAVGQVVEIEFSGPILESYPAQAGASSVTVKK